MKTQLYVLKNTNYCQWTFLRVKKTKWIFHILVFCHAHLNQHHSRVSEWFLQSDKFGSIILGDCKSKAKATYPEFDFFSVCVNDRCLLEGRFDVSSNLLRLRKEEEVRHSPSQPTFTFSVSWTFVSDIHLINLVEVS